ncbi:MAG: ABC transporter substrate-binding protein [Chloroflexi bacterium]|nr:ABC transporter substrate-binding protein [Chloroflexota bacterium]
MRKNALLVSLAGLLGWWTLGYSDSAAKPAPPKRICSVTLATDEMLLALVESERVVAVTYLVDDAGTSNVSGRYPKPIPRIRADLEKIIALRPDLVCVAPYNSADFLELLRKSNLPTFRHENINTFAEVEHSLVMLGERVGALERAKVVVAEMERRLGDLQTTLASSTTRPRVLYWSGGWTAGHHTTIGEMIERAGGINVAAGLGMEGMAEISAERVLAADPDVLLLVAWKVDNQDTEAAMPPALRTLRAVREGHVVSLEGRYLSTVSQFVVDGAERLARKLHPECFREGRR